jgi:hypothetical protein
MSATTEMLQNSHDFGALNNPGALSLLKRAIAAKLSAWTLQEKRRPPKAKLVSFRDICAAHRAGRNPFLDDPTISALNDELAELGWHLYRLLGNIQEMEDVAEEIAMLVPRRADSRLSIIRGAWEGIGDGKEGWWNE